MVAIGEMRCTKCGEEIVFVGRSDSGKEFWRPKTHGDINGSDGHWHEPAASSAIEVAPREELDGITIDSAINFLEQSKMWAYADEVRRLKAFIDSGDNPDGHLIYKSDHEKILTRARKEASRG